MFKKIIFFLFLLLLKLSITAVNSFTISLQKTRNSVIDENHLESSPAPKSNDEKKVSGILNICDACPKDVDCVPQIQCPAHVRMKSHEKPQRCDLPSGKLGFCCATGQNHTAYNKISRSADKARSMHSSIIEEARIKFASLLHHASHTVERGHPDFLHNIVFHSSHRDTLKVFQVASSAMEQIVATQILKEKEHIPLEEFETNSIDISFSSSPLGQNCGHVQECLNKDLRYRTADGSCNNPLPRRSFWGAAGQPMERLLPPAYDDGIWEPRMHSVDGSPLASAREISRVLLPDIDRPHPRYNLLLMQFGQFIAHDVTQSASVTLGNGDAVQCCSNDGSHILPPHLSHFACMAIPVEPHDEFYRMFNQGCINFVRLSLAPNPDCKVGYGKQLSKVTHYLDGSQIYGSDIVQQNELRSFHGGKLRMFNDFGRDLLPLSRARDDCATLDPTNVCFQSGDGRTNQIISLVVLHILFAREHNRIADAIASMNPHFSDETLYQEAKRIVIAEYQHIAYHEWLPLVIGSHQMKRFSLTTKHHGYDTGYSTEINAAITNEFSGAAFRFGHSVVDGRFRLRQKSTVEEIIEIPDVMFNPTRLRKRSFYDDLIRTLTDQPMQKVDNSITVGLSRFLFRGSNPFGLDLAALNIQRGRDHGLRSYNDYLEVIGRHRVQNFKEFGPQIAEKLEMVYKHPDDIDLWVGGLLEAAENDALVGSTFSEIIADQFSRFRRGDRYFYEYGPNINPGFFTHDQLQEIKKSSMARIICDNLDGFTVDEIAPFAFLRSDIPGNNPISCGSHAIPIVNLNAWKDD